MEEGSANAKHEGVRASKLSQLKNNFSIFVGPHLLFHGILLTSYSISRSCVCEVQLEIQYSCIRHSIRGNQLYYLIIFYYYSLVVLTDEFLTRLK